MAHITGLNCCGVGELVVLNEYTPFLNIIEDAKDCHIGMIVAFFVKPKGKKEFDGKKLLNHLLKNGFKKQRIFINPNTGNTLQPVYYVIPKKYRAETIEETW